ncbi:MAG TPA: cation diffusion facilitator family transporter [Solirubrobacteraceae bacterium]|jgi:cobalt-zinc-cadmium efflux system protein|nr:cation diffusion facilitator family transporter [Solirubrobacteraceae bacterium]
MAGAHVHAHHVRGSNDRQALTIALALIVSFMLAEVVVGILADSLALISDAGHMLTDAAAIALSLVAARLASKPAEGAMTYGLGRAEILSAQANGITLLVLAVLIAWEAAQRLGSPPQVDAAPVLVVALAGVAVNLLAARVLAGAGRESLNVEGSFRHVVTDLYAFIATALAAIVILATGFDRADAIASLFVAALMLYSAYSLLRASGRIFLEAAPEGVDVSAIGNALAAEPHVVQVHDLHVWEVTSGFPALSAHVLVERDCDCHAVRARLEGLLEERFALTHTTLQVEHETPEQLLEIQPRGDGGA